MKRKNIMLSLLAFMLFLLIAGCGSSDVENDGMSATGDNDDVSNDVVVEEIEVEIDEEVEEEVDIADLSEEERYFLFEAEVGCLMIEAGMSEDPNAMLNTMGDVQEIGEKYDLKPEEIEVNVDKYENDPEFQARMLKELERLCPETYRKAMEQAESE